MGTGDWLVSEIRGSVCEMIPNNICRARLMQMPYGGVPTSHRGYLCIDTMIQIRGALPQMTNTTTKTTPSESPTCSLDFKGKEDFSEGSKDCALIPLLIQCNFGCLYSR